MAYDENFISGHPVKLPAIKKKSEIAPLLHGAGYIINYSHYSVVMNKKRKFAFFSAANIDGNEWKYLDRKGSFRKDTKTISANYQFGNELYNAITEKGGHPNDFQEGHLTSFQEATWGKTVAERKKAADDTFYFTNCVPQHGRLNVGLWRSLEQYVLKSQTIDHDLKVTVLTGPLLSDNDPFFIKKIGGELVRIPCAFWKVIYYPNKKGLNAVGFMMSQTALLVKDKTVTFDITLPKSMRAASTTDDLFMDYKYDAVYQVMVEFIQEKTGLRFMLSKVHLPYQVKVKTDVLFKRIEVPPGRAMAAKKLGILPLDFQLEGITL